MLNSQYYHDALDEKMQKIGQKNDVSIVYLLKHFFILLLKNDAIIF